MRLALRKLADLLPDSADAWSVDAHRAITTEPVTVPTYVWPDVAGELEEAEVAPVVLVSAPGAMGKSEAARNLARARGAVYVDLAALNVGSGTLLGELTKALGAVQLDQFTRRLREGRASIVIDSTDEAQLRSGAENFIAFLQDLDWFLDSASVAPRVILFGRSDSMVLTEAALSELGIEAPLFELQPMSLAQSIDLMWATLDSPKFNLHRLQPDPFERLARATLSNLASALVGEVIDAGSLTDRWSQFQSFLGYPPVLQALAERLRVTNPQAELAQLLNEKHADARRERGVLLRGIVETILDREQGKVAQQVGEAFGIGLDDPSRRTIYTRDEQVARLLDHTGSVGVRHDRPTHLIGDERQRYDKLIASFVQDHPFVRSGEFANQVFSDYARAWAVSSPVGELLAVNRTAFWASLPPVGAFFARFLQALNVDARHRTIPEELVDDAIRSHTMGSAASTALYQHSSSGDATLTLIDDRMAESPDDIEFAVPDSSGVLKLTSPIARLVVVSDFGVVLDGASGHIDIGPEAIIIADELQINAISVRATGGANGAGLCMLFAHSRAEHDRNLRVHTAGPLDLIVRWPDPWHQWSKLLPPGDLSHRNISYALAAQVVVAVRKILLAFHSSMGENPAVSADKVDRVLVGANGVAAVVRDVLLDFSLISRHGQLYELDLDRLGAFGVSWNDVSGNEPFTTLRQFCEKVTNSARFGEAARKEGWR